MRQEKTGRAKGGGVRKIFVISAGYDLSGNLVSETDPASHSITYECDALGRLVRVTDAQGRIREYQYDALDRMTQKVVPGSGTYDYTYDINSRLTSATGPGGTITNTYDTAGRLTGVAYPGSRQVGFTYDAASQRTRLTYPDGSYVTYEYDQLGRLTAVNHDPNDESTEPAPSQAASYAYDDLSRRTGLTYANGASVGYTYSIDNNLTSLTHNWAGGGSTVLNYTYDNTGLRTGFSSDDDRFAPLFNTMGTNNNTPNTLNQYTQSAGETLTYDGNGNLTGDGTNTYTYDAANQMTAANGDTYAYDPFGRRKAKTVDSATTTYIYAGDQAIAEYGASGLEKKYVYGPGIDEPIFMNANSATHYYHADALSSVIAMTDGSGAVAETYRYTAFGQVEAASALGNPYLYTGRRLDAETGLYYYRARYYDAGLMRFLQADPIGYDGGMNLYAYVGNSPLSFVDPFGLRKLTFEEGLFINEIFLGTVDPKQVDIEAYDGDRARTLNNTIYVPQYMFETDFSKSNNIQHQGIFIHEITHVWQYQNNDITGYHWIWALFEHLRSDTYKYTLCPESELLEYRFEQQAKIVEHYFYYSRKRTPHNMPAHTQQIEDMYMFVVLSGIVQTVRE